MILFIGVPKTTVDVCAHTNTHAGLTRILHTHRGKLKEKKRFFVERKEEKRELRR